MFGWSFVSECESDLGQSSQPSTVEGGVHPGQITSPSRSVQSVQSTWSTNERGCGLDARRVSEIRAVSDSLTDTVVRTVSDCGLSYVVEDEDSTEVLITFPDVRQHPSR